MNNEVRCTECGSSNYIKAGLGWRNREKNVQRYRCKDCGKVFVLKNGKVKEKINAKS